MKRFFFAVAIAAIASIIVAAAASAKVERYGPQTATFTVTQPAGQVGQWDNVWTHDFTVTVNPDGTFEGTGKQSGADQNGPYSANETVKGTFANGSVNLTATRDDGLKYTLENAPYDGTTVTRATLNVPVTWPIEMKVTQPVFTDIYKNHGDYVSSQGGGKDAAQSPIGKPVNSVK